MRVMVERSSGHDLGHYLKAMVPSFCTNSCSPEAGEWIKEIRNEHLIDTFLIGFLSIHVLIINRKPKSKNKYSYHVVPLPQIKRKLKNKKNKTKIHLFSAF